MQRRTAEYSLAGSSLEHTPGSTSTLSLPFAPLSLPWPKSSLFLPQMISIASHWFPSLSLFAPSIHSPHSSLNDLYQTHIMWLPVKTHLEVLVVIRVTSECWLQLWSLCKIGPWLSLPTVLYTLMWLATSKMVPCDPFFLAFTPLGGSSPEVGAGPPDLLLLKRRQQRWESLKADPA